MYDFLLVFFSNFVPKMHRFWDIQLQKCRDLENGLGVRQGHLKYYPSIERIQLPIVVSEIFNVEKCRDLEIGVRGHSRSLKWYHSVSY